MIEDPLNPPAEPAAIPSDTPVVKTDGETVPARDLAQDDGIMTNHRTVNSDDDDDDVIPATNDTSNSVQTPVSEPAIEDDDSVSVATDGADTTDDVTDTVLFPEDKIDLRGEKRDDLVNLLRADEEDIGPAALDALVRTVGSWENLMFRAMTEPSLEEMRIQQAISHLKKEDRDGLSSRYKREGKTLLRTASIIDEIGAGETKTLSGDAAVLAFECQEKGGGYRIPLYNSGITIDVIVPTGNDLQLLLSNCLIVDRQLGSANGAHYFTYSDVMYKTQILNFLEPLIINSSYVDWRKRGKLWSVIKLPDVTNIVATLAALCYKDGFDGFVTKCTRPVSKDHPNPCRHTETLTINVFETIVTRFAAMNKESIDFMVSARMGNGRNTLTQIAKYQSDLGFEGERLTFGNITFTMRIPSVAEHIEAGTKFIADIVDEIEGDNTEGRYEQFGFRYIRTLLPWIAMVEKKGSKEEVVKTTEPRVIVRMLEQLDDKDKDGAMRETLRGFIDKTQLTYVGYPVIACDVCGYVADTPSGMWTFDPFTMFFTLAFLYLRPESSTTTTA